MYGMKQPSRRSVLRGMTAGAAVTVGLPLLDMFLNSNGDALATGEDLPVYFGTWFQGLGFTPTFWEPKTVGANYENNAQLKALDPIKHKVTIFSGSTVYMDSNSLVPHESGPSVCLTGGHPKGGQFGEHMPTIDTIIADSIGTTTRFRSLNVSCDGTNESFSWRSSSSVNTSESNPVELYKRIFGPDFKDPNAAEFTPDPTIMARHSVLSSVGDGRANLNAKLGASDKARIDEYFTSLRELEMRLATQLQKPKPIVGCAVASGEYDADMKHSRSIDSAQMDNRLHAQLLAHALSCDQTRVFTLMLAGGKGGSPLRRANDSMNFHTYTHEEAVDQKLGLQPNVDWFQKQVAATFAEFITTFDKFKVGDKTLLDRSLVMYNTDLGLAKIHSQVNLPLMFAGGAGGRVKPGMHVVASGQTAARVGLTAQQIMGVPTSSWGTESNKTSKPYSEILA